MWSMQQQETSSMGHAILEAGMPPFFELGQKPEIWGIPPNGAVTGSKWVGVKQQKSGKYSKLEELHEA